MTWQEFIQDYTHQQIKAAFPRISDRLPYSWRSGEREPPEYAQEAMRHWLRKAEQDDGANGDNVVSED